MNVKQRKCKLKELVRHKFDNIAEIYFNGYNDNSYLGEFFRVRKKIVLELFDKHEGKVLDVGCGPGIMVEDLKKVHCKFWGIDASWRMIEQCKKNFGSNPYTHFSVGNAENLPFPDNSFHAVICMGVIEFLEHDELAIKEMIRVLRNNGTLLCSMPNKKSPYNLWIKFVFNPIIRPTYYSLTKKQRNPESLIRHKSYREKYVIQFLKHNHCQVLDKVYLGYNLLLKPLDFLFPYLTGWINKRFERLCRTRLKWLATCFVVKAKKL